MNTIRGELRHFENPVQRHRTRAHVHLSESRLLALTNRFDVRRNAAPVLREMNAGANLQVPFNVQRAFITLTSWDERDALSRSTPADVIAAAFTVLFYAGAVWFGGILGGIIAIPVVLIALGIANYFSKRR